MVRCGRTITVAQPSPDPVNHKSKNDKGPPHCQEGKQSLTQHQIRVAHHQPTEWNAQTAGSRSTDLPVILAVYAERAR